MKIDTLAIHAGQAPDPTTGAVMVPIYQVSTYAQDGVGGHKGYEYSRTDNPTRTPLQVCLAALEGAAHAVGAKVVVDNTFATPYFQRPLALGADFVVHSTTKYLNGHSDVVGGMIATNDTAAYDQLKFLQNAAGAVPGPMDCWLTLRGLKTFHVRMDRHQQTGRVIAEWLSSHPQVERVYSPLLASHPNADVVKRQMSGFGGMISFELKGDLDRARRYCGATHLFTLAESLGGVESLIELPALMTHASVEPAKRREIGIADGLVRISVGLEHVDDLRADLEAAFRVG